MKLCLNMIVRNEADKIERCLASVAPYIDSYVILDTGSTDGTQECIKAFFEERKIPGEVVQGTFTNFEQARNDALSAARAYGGWDYLLLDDADMELIVEDHDFKKQLIDAPAYYLTQVGGGLSYQNTRFLHKDTTCKYIGVTHEYLDIPCVTTLSGVWYKDHADGSNRNNKFKRDIKLLRAALRTNPRNQRYWFYLGQSYQDAGAYLQAIHAYKRRLELGGWDEETFITLLRIAHCHKALGHDDAFVAGAMEAYNFRPSRAEPLYDLANYYRLKGKNHAALAMIEEGMRVPYPGDLLFVSDYPYKYGFRAEYAITGYYDTRRRAKAFDICNGLALDPAAPEGTRNEARGNLVFYARPLCESVPSFVTRRILFDAPADYTAMNPCVTIFKEKIKCLVRTVNYTMDADGRYLIKGTNGEANGTNPIHTRNFLIGLSDTFAPYDPVEVRPPEGFPPPKYPLVVGFEDMRIFEWRGELWSISNVRDQNPEGWCEQYLARITPEGTLDAGRAMLPAQRQHEKNWAASVMGDKLRFVYHVGELINPDTMEITKTPVPYAVDNLRGGSQYINVLGSCVGVVHEAHHKANGKRYYLHRFVMFDINKHIVKISKPFMFHENVIEFAAGIALHPDGNRVMISYGREDKEAWLATVDKYELMEFIHG